MDSSYEFSITKVNYIINKLPQEAKEKIPQNVINFFNTNANSELLPDNFLESKNIIYNCDETDKKFLKIVDYYINGF